MAVGFQTSVGVQPAPGVEGDFCDHNPRSTVTAGPGGLVAGAAGVIVGRFAWFDPASPKDPNDSPRVVISSAASALPVVGFCHREQQGLITNYLGGSSMLVPGGFPITLFNEGGFFVINRGAARATLGMKVFATLLDGSIQCGAAGATVAGAIETKWFCSSEADPNQLLKIVSWPLG